MGVISIQIYMDAGDATLESDIRTVKLSDRIDLEENKRELWNLLFNDSPPPAKKINIEENAGIIAKLVGKDFSDEEIRVFLESED